MDIGKTIAALRKEKQWTQARLAEQLGVTEQAVSKWETAQTVPDISLFPRLAELFGCSTDLLFGYERKCYDDEIAAVLKTADDSGDTEKEIEILTDGLRRYPNSAKLKTALAFSLSIRARVTPEEEERDSARRKAVRLCEEVVGTSSDERTRDGAWNMLSRIYCESGDYGKALDAASQIGAESYFLRTVGMANALGGAGDDEKTRRYAETEMWKLWWTSGTLLNILVNNALKAGETGRAAAFAGAWKKLLSVWDGDDGGHADFYLAHKLEAAERQARIAKADRDRTRCLEALREFGRLAERVPSVAASEDFRIGKRNPVFFGYAAEEDALEEYFGSLVPDALYRSFDDFFGNDPGWKAFRSAE